MKKYSLMTSILLASILLLNACSFAAPTVSPDLAQTLAVQTIQSMDATASAQAPTETLVPEPTATPEPTKEITTFGPDSFPEGVNPLTGLKVADPELLKRRPIMVKVSNFPPEGRPHAGLSSADIVFAYAMPGSMSRYLALYYGQDSNNIGPVRSVRLVDPDLVNLYQGVLAGSGGNPETVLPYVAQELGNRALYEGICPGICDDGRGWVISVFSDSAALTKFLKDRGDEQKQYDLSGMLFDKVPPAGGIDTPKLSFNFSVADLSDWTYDEEQGKYLRWVDNAPAYTEMIPLVDRNTEKQLAFSNVIIIEAYYEWVTNELYETEIHQNTNGQKAIFLRDGKRYEGTWKVTDPNKPMQFFGADGKLFPLKPGNTWIAITNIGSKYEEVDGVPVINFDISSVR